MRTLARRLAASPLAHELGGYLILAGAGAAALVKLRDTRDLLRWAVHLAAAHVPPPGLADLEHDASRPTSAPRVRFGELAERQAARIAEAAAAEQAAAAANGEAPAPGSYPPETNVGEPAPTSRRWPFT